jgi:hypothetical protein
MEWKLEGNCVGVNPSEFYPVGDKAGRTSEDDERRNTDDAEWLIAVRYCTDCPVEKVCFEYALANREPGVWGRSTEQQRIRIRRNRRKAAA